MAEGSTSPALRLALKALGNVLLVFGMNHLLPGYFTVAGGFAAYVIIGALLTLLNMFLRPFLAIVTFPFHLLFTLFTTIAVNAFFLWVVVEIAKRMDPNLIVLTITGGVMGWLVVSLVLGIGNWVMKHVL